MRPELQSFQNFLELLIYVVNIDSEAVWLIMVDSEEGFGKLGQNSFI